MNMLDLQDEHFKERSLRYPFHTFCSLQIPFQPWAIHIPAQAVNISETGILMSLRSVEAPDTPMDTPAAMAEDSMTSAMTHAMLQAFEKVLTPGDEYDIQINHAFHHLEIPVVSGILQRKTPLTESLLHLGLSFSQMPPELLNLLQEIRGSSVVADV